MVGSSNGGHQVLQPQLCRVHVQLAGEVVHDPLVRVRRLRAAGSPVRVGRGEVGEDPDALEGIGVEGVEARIREGAKDGDARREELQVCTHVRQEPDFHAKDLAFVRGGELDVLNLPAAVDGRNIVLGTILDPLDRHAQACG